jgi:hypothetical protein
MDEEELVTLRKKVFLIPNISYMLQMKMKKYQNNLLVLD